MAFCFCHHQNVQRPKFRDILWRMGNFCISWGRSSFPVSDLFQVLMMKPSKLWHFFLEILLILLIPKKEICHVLFSSYTWTPSVIFFWSLPDIFLFRPGIRWAVVVETQCFLFFWDMVWEHPWSLFFERGWNEDNQFIMYILGGGGGGFKDVSNLEEMMYFNELIFQTRWFNHQLGVSVFLKGQVCKRFFSGWSF